VVSKSKKQVFVITHGSYSSYTIHAVFSSRKLAQEFLGKLKAADDYRADGEIEVWELDKETDVKVLEVWRCGILLDTGEVKEKPYMNVKVERRFRGRVIQSATKIPLYQNRRMSRVESTVSAKHCLKLAVEERQRWLREGKALEGLE